MDIGNTRYKWHLCDMSGKVEVSGSAAHESALETLTIRCGGQSVSEVWLSSVVPEQTQRIQAWSADVVGVQARNAVVVAQALGVECGYEDYRQLGVDRWLAMIAAYRLYSTGFVLVQAGSALVVDVVASNGRHQGGYIAPGISMMVASMSRNLAQLPEIGLLDAGSLRLGGSTEACVLAGSWAAAVGLIEKVGRLSADVEGDLPVLFAGGNGVELMELCSFSEKYSLVDPVLQGLAVYGETYWV